MGWRGRLLTPELEGPGVGIRRMDAGGLATCLIRLDAGLKTDPLFAGLPDDRCQCAHWGYTSAAPCAFTAPTARAITRRVRRTSGNPATTFEAVTDAEYIEITRSEEYDALMAHCKRVMGG